MCSVIHVAFYMLQIVCLYGRSYVPKCIYAIRISPDKNYKIIGTHPDDLDCGPETSSYVRLVLKTCSDRNCDLNFQSVPFKTLPNNNHVLRYKNKIISRSPRVILSNLFLGTRVKVTLVARPLLTPVSQKLCRCKHCVFKSRTCVRSRTLLRIEIIFCCSWSI
jgi:hypothetical protein